MIVKVTQGQMGLSYKVTQGQMGLSYNYYAAVDKLSTDVARRAVPLSK